MNTWLDWFDVQSRRRPLAIATAGFVAGLASAILGGALVAVAIAVRRRAFLVLAAAALAGWARGALQGDPPQLPIGQPRTFTGTVVRAFEHDPAQSWKSRQSVVDLDAPPSRVLAQGERLPTSTGAGDRVELTGALSPLPPERSAPGFDLRRWLDHQNVLAVLRLSSAPRPLPPSRAPYDRLRRLRREWGALLTDALHDDAASRLARSILLGDRNAVARDSERAFRATGTTHVLVASGMNVMLLAGVLAWVFSRIGAPRPAVRTALLLLTVGYAAVAGAEAPIVRAAVALSAWFLAEAVGRPADPLNLLGLAAIVLLALDPDSLRDPAFQLSFAAVASLVLLTPALLGRRRSHEEEPTIRERIREGSRRLLAANAAAWIGTAPLVLFHFGTLAPIALAANLVVAPLVWLVLTSSLALLAAQALPIATPGVISAAVALPAQTLDAFVRACAEVPGGCLSLPQPTRWGVLGCYACIAAGAAISRKKGRGWLAAGLACGAAALSG